jgi:SSS family solute:Na+ symporter
MTVTIRPLDVTVVVIYVAAILALGLYCARRATAAENYFVGRRNFPGWAVSLSMLGTIISSTTFLALPAAAYVLDWRQLHRQPGGAVPRRPRGTDLHPVLPPRGLTSAFEYLGDRFGVVPGSMARWGSSSCNSSGLPRCSSWWRCRCSFSPARRSRG